METAIWFGLNALLIGVALGAFIGYRAGKRKSNDSARVAALEATETELRNQLKAAEQKTSEQMLLQEKENKVLLELAPVKQQLEQMQNTVQRLERERLEQFSTISEQLKSSIEIDENLRKQTQALSQALTSNSLRGVWGEYVAEGF